MGRKAHPTALRLIKGNPTRRPLNAAEPSPPPGRPTPPEHLGPEARAEWERISGDLYAIGVLTLIDRAALAAYCTAYGRWIQAETALTRAREAAGKDEGGGIGSELVHGAMVSPLVRAADGAMRDLMRYAVEFGMTPSARSKVKATPPSNADEEARKYLA